MATDQTKSGNLNLSTDDRARLNRIGKLSQSILLVSAVDLEKGQQINPGEFLSALAMVTAHTIAEYYALEHRESAMDHHVSSIQKLVRDKIKSEKS